MSSHGLSFITKSCLIPDLVAAVYGNGRAEARVRGNDAVLLEAPDTNTLVRELKLEYPAGFTLDIRYDPHM